MKDKSNKFMMILAIAIIIATVIGIVFYILYQKTDFGKSNETLFKKYILQNLSYFEENFDFSRDEEYANKLINDSYIENTKITVNCNNENYNFDINSNNNKENNKFYSDIKIKNNDKAVTEVEVLNKDNNFGIRFTDIVKQFVMLKNENLSEFINNLGIEEDKTINKFGKTDLSNCFTFTDDEKKELASNYYKAVFQNFDKSKYKSQSNKMITLSNGSSVTAKAYILTLNQNEVNNIYKRILNQLVQDEIIINKLDLIDSKIKEVGIEDISLKEDFVNKINEVVENYEYTGKSDIEYKVLVYVLKGNLLRTSIEYDDKKITVDVNQNDGKNINLKYSTTVNNENVTKTYDITKKSIDNGYELNYIYNDEQSEYDISRVLTEDSVSMNLVYKYNDEKKCEISLDKNIKYESSDANIIDEDKIVVLNNYTSEEALALINNLKERINSYFEPIQQEYNSSLLGESINIFNNYINSINQNKQSDVSAEITKFNSQFELYKGEEVKADIVQELIKLAGNNMKDYKVANENQVRIYLENGTVNTEMANSVSAIINKKSTYIVSLGYNDQGVLETITLIPNEKN